VRRVDSLHGQRLTGGRSAEVSALGGGERPVAMRSQVRRRAAPRRRSRSMSRHAQCASHWRRDRKVGNWASAGTVRGGGGAKDRSLPIQRHGERQSRTARSLPAAACEDRVHCALPPRRV
jgi:hypothetical protein